MFQHFKIIMKSIAYCTITLMLLAGCSQHVTLTDETPSPLIRINQLGFYPEAIKEFVLVDQEANSFQVVDLEGKVHYKGNLEPRGTWEASGEEVRAGGFTRLTQPGTYRIYIAPDMVSPPFEIKESAYLEELNGAIKSFYFQRASMPIESQYGGIYQREAGHPDLNCPYHPSTGVTGGTLDSPGGWYDAGDYGKYIVNAAISVSQMLDLVDLFPDVVRDGQLNIPESGNGISDLLDEIRYELNWMLTMQHSDGGVFHKLTAKNFAPFIMPADYDLERWVIGKGTAATLNFAATMAQAARIFAAFDPPFAKIAIASAERAWKWALEHPDIPFSNPGDVTTGAYGDNQFGDDFYWAAAELYSLTGKQEFLEYLLYSEEPYIHQITNSWKFFIRNMGFHSLLANRDELDQDLIAELTRKHLELSDQILEHIASNPYRVGLEHFEWGSNSDVLNQAMILCYAHLISGEEKYLTGAIQNVDYIFGKNATGYSFLTGFGTKQVMNPHHRPSGADGIEAPVPGFIVGGPNGDRQDRQQVEYHSDHPAKAYEDVQASYASNEVCLNWNAPAVFVLGYLEIHQ
jgi:endoglucanase